MKTKIVILMTLIFFPLSGFSLAPGYGIATGEITRIYHYGNGRILVSGFSFPGATCTNNGGFWIAQDNPHINALLATLLSAHARGASLEVRAKIEDCWYPEIGLTTDSRIQVLN